MFCAFFSLLMICGGIGVLVWLAWQRLSVHLQKNPEAAKLLADHLIVPLLTGEPQEKQQPPSEMQNPE